jgi:hypothetical protein
MIGSSKENVADSAFERFRTVSSIVLVDRSQPLCGLHLQLVRELRPDVRHGAPQSDVRARMFRLWRVAIYVEPGTESRFAW